MELWIRAIPIACLLSLLRRSSFGYEGQELLCSHDNPFGRTRGMIFHHSPSRAKKGQEGHSRPGGTRVLDTGCLHDKFFAAFHDAGNGFFGIFCEFSGPFAGVFHHVL